MFTNEFESDKSITTILDEEGKVDDIRLYITDTGEVLIKQYEDFGDWDNRIVLTPRMFDEMLAALQSPEGAYRLK